MATLDDKLLGEKLQNYCSSSEDENENDNDHDNENDDKRSTLRNTAPKFISEKEIKETNWEGMAQNTGPKGVIKDWQRFKQLEQEKNQENERERRELIKKMTLTCRSDDLDKELEKEGMKKSNEDVESDLLQDEFLHEYLKKRMEEMTKKLSDLPKFGKVLELTNDMFLNEIDKEHKNVTIIVHIYDQKIPECRLMNQCIETIASDYPIVKFCKVRSSEINLSEKFRKTGCPALLVYKNAELIGNFVRMNDEFGDEFCSSDVENFLLEHNYLPSQEFNIIRSSGAQSKSNDDDDDDE